MRLVPAHRLPAPVGPDGLIPPGPPPSALTRTPAHPVAATSSPSMHSTRSRRQPHASHTPTPSGTNTPPYQATPLTPKEVQRGTLITYITKGPTSSRNPGQRASHGHSCITSARIPLDALSPFD